MRYGYIPQHAAPMPPFEAPAYARRLIATGMAVIMLAFPTAAAADSDTRFPRRGEGMISLVTRTCGTPASWRANAAANGVKGPAYVIRYGHPYSIDCARRGTPTTPASSTPGNARGWGHPLGGRRCGDTWGAGRGHRGADFRAPAGTPIRAAAAGTVKMIRYQANGAGHYVMIRHKGSVFTVYMHMRSRPALRVGQSVARGQLIGRVGSTGDATGPHLHFETHTGRPWYAVNPVRFMTARGVRLCR